MFKNKSLRVLALCILVGCSSDDDGVEPLPNVAPTISFTFTRLAVARSSDVILTVAVDDPDGDPVTVNWAVTRGLLNPANQGSASMRWTTAAAVGRDTITVTASDGHGGQKTIRPVVEVGTPWAVDVVGTTTWTLANSPYVVSPAASDRVTIFAPAGRLTVDAGVEVYINQTGMSIDVEDELIVAGTPGVPVVIKPNLRAPQPGYWKGIVGIAAGVIDLSYTVIPNAESAVRTVGTASIALTGCTIMSCTESAILHQSRGTLLVEDCAITNNLKSGIHIDLLAGTPSAVTIRGDSIAVNGRFQDETTYPDGEAAIALAFDDPTNTVPIDISNNEISRNDFPGIRLLATCFPRVTNNGIFGNEFRKSTGKINIELASPFGSGAINATNNWWGQTYPQASDSLVIKQGIHDNDDDFQIGTSVSVTPWKTVWP
jgi:parallel beta-helix repeat protein